MLADELDYSRVDEYIRSAEAFSRSTYQSVYVIDYFNQNFLYVSPNPMFLCGLTPEEIKELGYRFYLEYMQNYTFVYGNGLFIPLTLQREKLTLTRYEI